MCYQEYRRCACRCRKFSLGNYFASPFIRKIKISHTPHRSSKYDDGQESRPGSTKSCDAHRKKSKFATCKHGTDSRYDGVGQVLHRWPLSDAQGRKVLWIKFPYDGNWAKLKGLVDNLEAPDRSLILCAKNIGSWLSLRDTTVTNTAYIWITG